MREWVKTVVVLKNQWHFATSDQFGSHPDALGEKRWKTNFFLCIIHFSVWCQSICMFMHTHSHSLTHSLACIHLCIAHWTNAYQNTHANHIAHRVAHVVNVNARIRTSKNWNINLLLCCVYQRNIHELLMRFCLPRPYLKWKCATYIVQFCTAECIFRHMSTKQNHIRWRRHTLP